MSKSCPNCKKENSDSVSFCVACGYNLQEMITQITGQAQQCQKCNYPLRPEHAHCPQCGSKVGDNKSDDRVTDVLGSYKTANSNKAILKAVSLNQVSVNDIELNQPITILNRDMVDPNDRSISISEHCRITNENGRWFIENTASNKALFLQVNSKTELTDDLIVLIGNSKFFIFNNE